jgi:hypothetical protein
MSETKRRWGFDKRVYETTDRWCELKRVCDKSRKELAELAMLNKKGQEMWLCRGCFDWVLTWKASKGEQ